MKNQEQNVDQHLRIMHACEKGATGVYYGHRLVATFFYRDLIPTLTEMHAHEMEHYTIFSKLMGKRGVKVVFLPIVWCGGGIIYGVFTALLGRKRAD
ncbi:MAG: demethoxyubiquinone hydroxylase family protein [Bdellovibrio sp.]|nr:demethoxyubiquinone hydroxylase family protein [Methylotenera sp.]